MYVLSISVPVKSTVHKGCSADQQVHIRGVCVPARSTVHEGCSAVLHAHGECVCRVYVCLQVAQYMEVTVLYSVCAMSMH